MQTAEQTDWKTLPRPLLIVGLAILGSLSLWGLGRFVITADATAQSLLVEKERNDHQDQRLTATDQGLEKLTKAVDRMAVDQVCANLYESQRLRHTPAAKYFVSRLRELGGRCE